MEDLFRKELEERLERSRSAPRGTIYEVNPDPYDVVEGLLTNLLAAYDRHNPPRRDTPMTVEEVETWADGVDWLPEGCTLSLKHGLYGPYLRVPGAVEVFAQSAEFSGGWSELPILDRICRETGWGGR